MLEALMFLIENAKSLLVPSLKYQAGDGKDGISVEDTANLQATIDNAETKNTAQQMAVEAEEKMTELQTATIEKGRALIRKTQNAGQAEFGNDDKARKSEFHIGADNISSVKKMDSELKYMKAVATNNLAALKKHGFKEADVASFDAISTELDLNSTNQKNAQNLQKAATNERDKAMKSLQKAVRRIQKSAKVVFADQPSVLIEFESIHEGRGGGKTPPQAPPSPPTAK